MSSPIEDLNHQSKDFWRFYSLKIKLNIDLNFQKQAIYNNDFVHSFIEIEIEVVIKGVTILVIYFVISDIHTLVPLD